MPTHPTGLMKYFVLHLMIAFIFHDQSVAQSGQSNESQKQMMDEILTAASARASALIAKDSVRLRSLLAPDFVYTNASGNVFHLESYIQNYVLDTAVSWQSQSLSDVNIIFSGNIAIMTAIIYDRARFGRYHLNARFRTTQVYRRSEKGWIYLAGHTSNIE